jgi:beta-lactamase superfamily II metal-dependent hydrolase
MYRYGLGDCFLLTFGNNQAHMLIDCGLIGGTPDAADKMRVVAQSIKDATNGHIDVLVATHQHWDHLSGFLQAREIFEQMAFESVWLAWTEDPSNELAKSLTKQRQKTERSVRMAIRRLGMAGSDQTREWADRLDGLMGFLGETSGAGLGAASSATTADALAWAAGRATPHYCHPGEKPLGVKGVEGVQVYVLGPPEDPAFIKQDLPSKRDPETYGLAAPGTLEGAFFSAARLRVDEPDELSPDERDEIQRSFPLDTIHQIDFAKARTMPFFREHYGFAAVAEDPDAWRRIEHDWLGAASQLALDLDSDTNNTSLVLAIELVESGGVLLFVGDAQVGNWLSWQKLSWQGPQQDGTIATVTSADLLKRTVLYKVGHHGSHNATLREQGLELMTSPQLAAMIPVDQAMAQHKKWNMPFPPLYRRLEEKTAGRVLRADQPSTGAHVTEGPAGLYVEYDISG